MPVRQSDVGKSISTEAQMVREALLGQQTLHTFIGLLCGLRLDETVDAIKELVDG